MIEWMLVNFESADCYCRISISFSEIAYKNLLSSAVWECHCTKYGSERKVDTYYFSLGIACLFLHFYLGTFVYPAATSCIPSLSIALLALHSRSSLSLMRDTSHNSQRVWDSQLHISLPVSDLVTLLPTSHLPSLYLRSHLALIEVQFLAESLERAGGKMVYPERESDAKFSRLHGSIMNMTSDRRESTGNRESLNWGWSKCI